VEFHQSHSGSTPCVAAKCVFLLSFNFDWLLSCWCLSGTSTSTLQKSPFFVLVGVLLFGFQPHTLSIYLWYLWSVAPPLSFLYIPHILSTYLWYLWRGLAHCMIEYPNVSLGRTDGTVRVSLLRRFNAGYRVKYPFFARISTPLLAQTPLIY
jgi:hypothetical protein